MSVGSANTEALRLVLDHLPDSVLDREEAWITFEGEGSGPLERHGEHALDAPGTRAHHGDAVGQIDRFVDLMGDEDNGLARLAPDLQQFELHVLAGLRVKGG